MDEPVPDACYYFDCKNFRNGVESIRESLRWCSGDPKVARPLIAARASIKEARVKWQDRRGHDFVSEQEAADQKAADEEEGVSEEAASGMTWHPRYRMAFPSQALDDEVPRSVENSSTSRHRQGNDAADVIERDGRQNVGVLDHGGPTRSRWLVTEDPEHVENGGHKERSADENLASDESGCETELAQTYGVMPPVDIVDKAFQSLYDYPDGYDDLTYYPEPECQEDYVVEKDHKDQKAMNCDHCMAHGLPCNEAAVCNQCRYHKQPCVHRLCPHSPDSRAACPELQCQYTHKDSTHYTFLEAALRPQWIVKAGDFPEPGSRGCLRPRAWLKPLANDESPGWEQRLSTRQKDGLQQLERRADHGQISYLSCACASEEESDPGKEAEDSRIAGPCPTCASRENYVALYRCGHWECHACALQQIRDQKTCPTCCETSFWLVFANDRSKSVHGFRAADFECSDFKLGIAYETARIRSDSVWLLEQLQTASEGLLISLD